MNRKFNRSDEAVSPVVGVILMVAITVVLAAVVFVLVTKISVASDVPVQLAFTYKDSDNSFTLLGEPEDTLSYSNLVVKNNGTISTYTVNGITPSASQTLKAGDKIIVTGLTAGEHDLAFIVNGHIAYSKTISV